MRRALSETLPPGPCLRDPAGVQPTDASREVSDAASAPTPSPTPVSDRAVDLSCATPEPQDGLEVWANEGGAPRRSDTMKSLRTHVVEDDPTIGTFLAEMIDAMGDAETND